MVVVAIIAILASLAVYGVRKYVLASQTSEAIEIINSVRAAQEQYKDERFRYLDVSSVDQASGSFFPFAAKADLSKNIKMAWDVGNATELARWRQLGVVPSTLVQFGYACQAGQGAGVPSAGVLGATAGSLPGTAPNWYVVRAMADRDGNGTYALFIGSNFNDAIYSENETE